MHDENFVKTVKTLSSAVQTQNDPNDATNAVALSVTEEESKLSYSQSDTTFIDKGVCDALQVTFPVQLKLTTMFGKDTVLQSERVSGQVRTYKSSNYIDLPPTVPTPKTAYLLIIANRC